MMKNENIVREKSKALALRIIKLYNYLCEDKHEFVLSKQILRSGTSIGANIVEATAGQSKADFYAKMYISYKEACETQYWLELLHESGYLSDIEFTSLYSDCNEIVRMLSSITAKAKSIGNQQLR